MVGTTSGGNKEGDIVGVLCMGNVLSGSERFASLDVVDVAVGSAALAWIGANSNEFVASSTSILQPSVFQRACSAENTWPGNLNMSPLAIVPLTTSLTVYSFFQRNVS